MSSLFQNALKARGVEIPLGGTYFPTKDPLSRPLIMGILNLSADSFSGDGFTNLALALQYAKEMVADGVDIIDVGGESARTNRGPISEEEETQRLLSFVQHFNSVIANTQSPPLLSINTWRPAVARAVLAHGGHILNDIGALPTPENAQICAEVGAALVIMHSVGNPKVPHRHLRYPHILDSLCDFFQEKLSWALEAGLDRKSIILDPGIDFAKQENDNLIIYKQLETLQPFGLPILLPVSRKHLIGSILNIREPNQRDAGTVACIVAGLLRGAWIFRVHNVKAAVYTTKVIHNMLKLHI